MLDRHGSVYLKPAQGAFGQGIWKVDKTWDGYWFTRREGTKSFAAARSSAAKLLGGLKTGKPYLVQQSDAFSHQNKHVDFRVILQKDAGRAWTCSGIVARFGRDGRIYTNDVSLVQPARRTLREVYRLDEEQAAQKEQEMFDLCRRACEVLESACGHFGDLGFDVAVDVHLKRVADFAWTDHFAEACNYAFELASMDFILWLDADDVLLPEERDKLIRLKSALDPGVDAVSMAYHCAFDDHGNVTLNVRRIRLVRRSTDWRWHGAVHEDLAVSGTVLDSDIVVTHRQEHGLTDRNLQISISWQRRALR